MTKYSIGTARLGTLRLLAKRRLAVPKDWSLWESMVSAGSQISPGDTVANLRPFPEISQNAEQPLNAVPTSGITFWA